MQSLLRSRSGCFGEALGQQWFAGSYNLLESYDFVVPFDSTGPIWGAVLAPTGFRSLVFLEVFGAVATNAKVIYFWKAAPLKLKRAPNEKHSQDECAIQLAFLYFLACHASAQGRIRHTSLIAFSRHLVDWGSHFGACWILKKGLNRRFPSTQCFPCVLAFHESA